MTASTRRLERLERLLAASVVDVENGDAEAAERAYRDLVPLVDARLADLGLPPLPPRQEPPTLADKLNVLRAAYRDAVDGDHDPLRPHERTTPS